MRRLLLASVVLLAACGAAGNGDTTGDTATTIAPPPATAPATPAPASPAPGATTTTSPSTTVPPEEGVVTIEVTVEAGTVEGGGRVRVPLGDRVKLTVAADVSDEVHVHGYDLAADVAPGALAVFEFLADIPGIFEVELHRAHSLLLDLEVAP